MGDSTCIGDVGNRSSADLSVIRDVEGRIENQERASTAEGTDHKKWSIGLHGLREKETIELILDNHEPV